MRCESARKNRIQRQKFTPFPNRVRREREIVWSDSEREGFWKTSRKENPHSELADEVAMCAKKPPIPNSQGSFAIKRSAVLPRASTLSTPTTNNSPDCLLDASCPFEKG